MRIKPIMAWLLITASILVVVGCRRPTEKEVLGTYMHSFGKVTDKIVLQTNGVFWQEIKYADGKVWNLTNTWFLTNLVICLEQSYMAYDEENQIARPSPESVAMCGFEWEGNGFSRWDGNILWAKSTLP